MRSSLTATSLHDLVLHRGIAASGGRSRSRGGSILASGVGARLKVVSHLRVQLLRGLLRRAGGAYAALWLLATSAGSSSSALVGIGVVALVVGRRLGLGFRLTFDLVSIAS